jgi:hypothetical protein
MRIKVTNTKLEKTPRDEPVSRIAFGARLAALAAVAWLALLAPAAAHAHMIGPRIQRGSADPLIPMLRRVDRYLQRHETAGVVLDWRVVINRTEAARLSVVPQLLGYCEIYKVAPSGRLRGDIVRRADYLVDHLGEFLSGGVFDGMLGHALLEAFEATRDPVYLAAGMDVVAQLKALPQSDYILNGGLMAAMAFAKDWKLNRNAESANLVQYILSNLPSYQNANGSFPHWCVGSTDIHYTDWMTTELILIQRMQSDSRIEPMLRAMLGFIEGRIDARGVTVYEEPCEDGPGCWIYYDSVRSGCGIDYDTRAFTNELGYSALLFDHFRSPLYPVVMRFMRSLESGGTWADKWDYWPPPSDPYYVWTAADTSVVNTSLIFWSLATVLSGRDRAAMRAAWIAEELAQPDEPKATDPVRIAEELEEHVVGRLRGSAPTTLRAYEQGAGAAPPAPPWVSWDVEWPRELARVGSHNATPPAPQLAAIGVQGPTLLAAPNPARESFAIRFTLPAAARVTVTIHDAAGRAVRTIEDGALGAGPHVRSWDGADMVGRRCASGVFFVRLRAGTDVRTARLLWLGANAP